MLAIFFSLNINSKTIFEIQKNYLMCKVYCAHSLTIKWFIVKKSIVKQSEADRRCLGSRESMLHTNLMNSNQSNFSAAASLVPMLCLLDSFLRHCTFFSGLPFAPFISAFLANLLQNFALLLLIRS